MNRRALSAALALAGAAALLWTGLPARAEDPAGTDGLYYLPAEVVSTGDGQTRFAQIDGEDPTQYVYAVPGTFPDHIPYLLTMDSRGTDTPADDTVVVVWGCMDGAGRDGPARF